ncbi:hypothetical protein AB3R30_04490 [Leptolyngbyaceae cyanobacterium UHCC 1019]
MTTPNYQEMSRPELKAYILEHRDDLEAMRTYFYDPTVQWQVMPPMFDEAGQPIEANIRFAEEALRQRIDAEDRKKRQGD